MSKIIIDICLFCSYTKSRAVKSAFALTKPKSGGFSCQDQQNAGVYAIFPLSPGFFPIQKGEADTPVILTVANMKRSVLWIWRVCPSRSAASGWRSPELPFRGSMRTPEKKLALALVEGRPLRIGGGDYRLCDGQESCGHDECFKRTYHQQYEKKERSRYYENCSRL